MNRVAVITGASRGIGRGIALELARTGFDLVLNYASNETAARQTAKDCTEGAAAVDRHIRVEICQADISNAGDRQELLRFTRDRFSRLDVLVNNAGVAPKQRADLLEATEESFDRLISINVKGPFFLTQAAAQWMIAQAGGANSLAVRSYRPKIITISSISAYTASANRGDYCVSKAALAMLTPLYAARLAEHGIQVFEIRPGIIATDMTEPVREKYERLIQGGLTPIARWGTPDDVGKAVAAITEDAFPFSTGEVLNIDGGFHLRIL
jgi:3-oxoacyl-[acyl-carrier protein] reductase